MRIAKPIKDCLICGKEIHRSKSQRGLKQRRGKKCVTCSKQCSRVYLRCRTYLEQQWRKNEM